jgi:hypothetical protein
MPLTKPEHEQYIEKWHDYLKSTGGEFTEDDYRIELSTVYLDNHKSHSVRFNFPSFGYSYKKLYSRLDDAETAITEELKIILTLENREPLKVEKPVNF